MEGSNKIILWLPIEKSFAKQFRSDFVDSNSFLLTAK